jgi:hypothetical protein
MNGRSWSEDRGEVLLLTQKIKADGKTYENGSRQTIAAIDGEKIRFESGLQLRLDDGRVRQGDAVTTYKAQGASKAEMIRVEDNRSLLAMANREDLHVAFTRHREQARMFVQDIGVLRQVANRSLIKDVMARDLETRKITSFVERMEALLRRARELAESMATKAARREQQGCASWRSGRSARTKYMLRPGSKAAARKWRLDKVVLCGRDTSRLVFDSETRTALTMRGIISESGFAYRFYRNFQIRASIGCRRMRANIRSRRWSLVKESSATSLSR